MYASLLRRVFLLLAFLSPVPPLLLAWDSWFLTPQSLLAFILAVVAYCYFMNALIMSTRLRLLDRLFGHDRVMRFHARMAALSLLCAIIHSRLEHNDYVPITLHARFGAFALLIFVVVTVVTLLFMVRTGIHRFRPIAAFRHFVVDRLGLDYSRIKAFHNVLALAAILLSIHVFLAFPESTGLLFRIYMGLYALVAILRWVFFKLFKPRLLRARNARVSGVRQLNEKVTEIRIKQGTPFNYLPGQFVFLRFPGSALGSEEHPFSLSSSPSELETATGSEMKTGSEMAVTVKAVGNYTSRLSEIRENDAVLMDGPYGRFTLNRSLGRSIVFIAGGIGITPIYSIIKSLKQDETRSITLIWSVRHESDRVYDQDIRRIEGSIPQFRYIALVSDGLPAGPDGGLVQAYRLEEHSPVYYFCGPPAMRKALLAEFTSLSIPRSRIIFENFSLG